MARTLDQLKNSFAAPQKSTNSSWKNFYPFWKMEIGEQAVVRFLPDQDEENPLGFLVENLTHRLNINGQNKNVPCLSMYGQACPCCELAQRYYNENNDDMGRKYYKKREYIGNIVVVESPFDIDPDPTVKLISIGPKIFKLIQAAFASGDLEDVPYDLLGGYDFRIVKSQQGQWADYSLSKFAPKQSALSEDMLANMDLNLLSDQRTTAIDRDTMDAMLIADQTGQNYVAPGAAPQAAPTQSAPAQTANTTAPQDSTPAPQEDVPAAGKADDILAQIRARAAAKAEG